ncbi:MAG: YiiD C-terminal domain-containing protein [Candidatus Thiodiazotropha sp.]
MTETELEQRIRTGIPLATQMDFQVLELTGNSIRVSGGAAQNVNVHGTAFAGSLYAVCTLALWGLAHSRLPEAAELVIAEGSIRYRKPVVGEIIAECQVDADAVNGFLDRLRYKGKSRLRGVARVAAEAGNAAEFSGLLFARLKE